MSDWVQLAHDRVAAGKPCALITVTRTEGSTPREIGARMLICGDLQDGTIGGGRLELDASERARALLATAGPCELGVTHAYNLGATLGQCCGGRVEVLIQRLDQGSRGFLAQLLELDARGERYVCAVSLASSAGDDAAPVQRMIVTRTGSRGARASDAIDVCVVEEAQRALREPPAGSAPRWLELPDGERRVLLDPAPERGLPLVLFGAGHVGRALVHVVAPLGWPITWVETRDDAFPAPPRASVTMVATNVPEACIDEAAPRSAFLIMTHDHALDFQLCERVLSRGDAVFCGLIGSRTKRAKLAHRLSARGFGAEAIARITCPIGLPKLSGKAPFEVAIAAAAQLLQVHAEQRR